MSLMGLAKNAGKCDLTDTSTHLGDSSNVYSNNANAETSYKSSEQFFVFLQISLAIRATLTAGARHASEMYGHEDDKGAAIINNLLNGDPGELAVLSVYPYIQMSSQWQPDRVN